MLSTCSPAIEKAGFVFTPTVALMQDQAKSMLSKGVDAVVMGDADVTLEELSPKSMIVYLSPEYIYGPSCMQRVRILKKLVQDGFVSLFAIDEAHLMFEWEHFR